MDVLSKRLVGWLRGSVTGSNAVGVYEFVTTTVAVFLTYSIAATISIAAPPLSTTTITLLSVGVWLATWAVLDMVTSRTLREPNG